MPTDIPSPPGTIDGIAYAADHPVYDSSGLGIVTDVLYFGKGGQVADRHLFSLASSPGENLQYGPKTVLTDGDFTVEITGFHDANGYEVDTFAGGSSPTAAAGELIRVDVYGYSTTAPGGAQLLAYDLVQQSGAGSAGQIDGVYYDAVMTIYNAAGQIIGKDWSNSLSAVFPSSVVATETFDSSGGYSFYVGAVLREQKVAGIAGEPYTSIVSDYGPNGALTSQTYYTASGAVYTPTHNDLSITLPAPETVPVSQTLTLADIGIVDPWAAGHPGTLALNVSAGEGTLTMTGATGSGGNALRAVGTLAQLNDDLATLAYHAPTSAGTDTITVNVWNQAGISVVGIIHETIAAAAA